MPRMKLARFAAHITRCGREAPLREQKALSLAGWRLAMSARGYIGQYQPARGPFAAWKPLAVSTLLGGVSPSGHKYPGKIELGYAPPDRPLLRTGSLRDSISFRLQGRSVIFGAADPVAKIQEFGTNRTVHSAAIPPRPFIGPALYVGGEREVMRIAEVVFKPLLTGRF